jgi:hypothetical protein
MRPALALLAALIALAAAPAARGDDVYTTSTCRAPDGSPAPTDGWESTGAADRANDCLRGGSLRAGPAQRQFNQQEEVEWAFSAPADTRIAGFTLYRTIRMESGPGWAWNWNLLKDKREITAESLVENCWAAANCFALGDGTVSSASRVAQSGLDTGVLYAFVDCNPGPCPSGTGANLIAVHRADFTLRDVLDPVIAGTPSGDLLDPSQPVAGVRSVSFSASDRGGGVYQATLEADGAPVVTVPVDENGGRCRQPFTGAVPCKLSASGTLSFDTARLPDGVHALRLVVTDATGTNATAYGPVQVRTQNQAAECGGGFTAKTTPVAASFKGTKRSAVTRRSGRATLVGRLAGVGGGVQVGLLARERRAGARSVVQATTVTGPDGSFTLSVPAGPSRRLRAGWRVRPTDAAFACSRALNLRVPARATLHASPHGVRPGKSVRLTGRLSGGRIPSRGKLVDLQAHERGHWRTFATVRTNRAGRFATRYRFSRGAPRKTYPMRIRVRPESSYPYALGYSKSVRVTVR